MSWIGFPEEALEESRRLNDMIEKMLAGMPSVHTVAPTLTREQRRKGGGAFPAPVRLPEGRDRDIPGPAGDIGLRIFAPARVDGVYLHIHGGGWVLGANDQQDILLHLFATRANLAVVSVEYRLAPEHPFPAGPDDCEAAALWLIENAKRELGSDRLIIGGESAGAHLAALTLLRLRDKHGAAAAFRGANLVFGGFDLGMTPSQRLWGERNLILSTPILMWFCDLFTPSRAPEQRRVPEISPLWADLQGLPPALFTVGTLDPLIDDSLFMHQRWLAAGNDSELLIYPESIHGFIAFPTEIAKRALGAEIDFVKRALSGGGNI